MNSNDARETSLSARTLSGLGWSYLSTFCKALLSLLVLVVLARLLTPVDFGLQGIAWIFIALGARFGQAVVGPAVVQRSELTDRHIQVGFTLSMLIGIAIMGIIWLLAPLIGEFFREAMAAQVLQVLSVVFVINGVGAIPTHLLRRNLQFKQLMVADILAYSIGYGFIAVVLAFQGFGVWSLVWGEIMHKVIHTAVVIRYSPEHLRPRWAFREATDLLSRGAGFSLAGFFEFVARQGGYFVIGRWLGVTSLGYYTRADRLILLPRNYVSQSLFQVLFPAMAQRQQGTDRLAIIYLHGTEILSLVALPVGAMLFVCSPEIVSVILGGQWGPVVILLQILAFAVLFQMCDVLNIAAAGAIGAVYRQAWRQGVHAFLVVGGAWLRKPLGFGGRSDCYCRRPGCRLSAVDTIDSIASKSAPAESPALLSAGVVDRRLGCHGTVADGRPGAGYAPVGRTIAVNRGPCLVRDDYRGDVLRPVIRSSLVRSLGNDEYTF